PGVQTVAHRMVTRRHDFAPYSLGGIYALIDTRFFDANSLCVAPNITAQPSNQTACVGAAATFSITASGDGLTYQWRKNSQNINGATSTILTLNNLTTNDNGSYYDVVITGTCGQLTSNAATLTVAA